MEAVTFSSGSIPLKSTCHPACAATSRNSWRCARPLPFAERVQHVHLPEVVGHPVDELRVVAHADQVVLLGQRVKDDLSLLLEELGVGEGHLLLRDADRAQLPCHS